MLRRQQNARPASPRHIARRSGLAGKPGRQTVRFGSAQSCGSMRNGKRQSTIACESRSG
ncbi:hypothetical protein Pan14r_50890 [Crateriforma conspicua]|uniref:Uncharacterized protein n=1 Tax=Crateriforma conspicua TaxID=2527996 RepID=A0A5C5XVC3_9PLAN|nr:hypothetical protein Pan14r_50890 [Crateriforma conspicua]